MNKIVGLEEDRIAKPHRPLPSGLISLEEAHMLYRCLLVCMWIAAFHCNTLVCTIAYTAAITIYNEGGFAAFASLKSVIGAFGLMCKCWGTTVTFGECAIYTDCPPKTILTCDSQRGRFAWQESPGDSHFRSHFFNYCKSLSSEQVKAKLIFSVIGARTGFP